MSATLTNPEAESYILSKVPMVPASIAAGSASYGNVQPAPGVYDDNSSVCAVRFQGTLRIAVTIATANQAAVPVTSVAVITRQDTCMSAQGGTTIVTLNGKQRGQFQKQCSTMLAWYRKNRCNGADGFNPFGNKQIFTSPTLGQTNVVQLPAIAIGPGNVDIPFDFTVPYRFNHFYPMINEKKLLSVANSFNIQQYFNMQPQNFALVITTTTGVQVPLDLTSVASIKTGLVAAGYTGGNNLTVNSVGFATGSVSQVGLQVYMRKSVNHQIFHDEIISVYEEQPYIAQPSFPCNFSIPAGQGSQYQLISIVNTGNTGYSCTQFDVPQTSLTNVQILKDGVNIVQSSETTDAITQMQMSNNFSGDYFPSLIQLYDQKYSNILLQHQITLSSNAYDTFMGIQKYVPNF